MNAILYKSWPQTRRARQ